MPLFRRIPTATVSASSREGPRCLACGHDLQGKGLPHFKAPFSLELIKLFLTPLSIVDMV